ncbi:Hypothetical predicted protein [Cloeon dipterum]|uniref:protein-tyrosine-phosphatase n=1 Tax=Cloeon dipterum TaxID=197152 RepID=A0A8S1BT47_9INSE|nr:Hypothetical predicted protein [Cloeon dipterum]
MFTCIVTFKDILNETSMSTYVTVLDPPESINFTNLKDEYKLEEQINTTCTVTGGYPPPSVNVYLGEKKLQIAKHKTHQQFGKFASIQVTILEQAKIEDNGKVLQCITNQENSDMSKVAKKTIFVCFKPQPIKASRGVIQKEGLLEEFEWRINGARINHTKYQEYLTKENELKGSWRVRLNIRKFHANDTKIKLVLKAVNKCGMEEYEIKLNSASYWLYYLLGSLIVVLLIIAIIVSAIVFRNTQTPGSAKQNERQSISPPLQSLLRNLETILDECDSDNELCKLSVEFQALTLENLPSAEKQPGKYSAALDPLNRDKNRFKHILPYDSSRVKLKTPEGRASDYINASFIKGISGKTEYIAAQAPLPKTVSDFWHMIFDNDVCAIIMATNFQEKGLEKCCKYYPNAHCGARYGEISVECVAHKDFPHFSQSTFRVKGAREGANASWNVVHVHIKNWSDVEFPNRQSLIKFLANVREYIAFLDRKMILVHCSGGTGRTGTLIAMDILLQEIKAKDHCDVYSTISSLRKQRMNVVHTEAQYKFLHECLRDFILIEVDRRADSYHEGRTMNSSEYLMPSECSDYHIYDYPVFSQAKSKTNTTDERTYLKILEN